jgi:broad specificity phosphatase PhoE
MRLFLVRHAWPQRDPNTPPETWPLSPTGRSQASSIALPWKEIDVVVSSPEPKALETARLASGREPDHDEDFREVERPWTPAYADALKEYFAGREPRGWEPRSVAARRGLDAVDRHAQGRAMALVSHATLMTLMISELQQIPPSFDTWLSIGYASFCEIDWAARRILRPFKTEGK